MTRNPIFNQAVSLLAHPFSLLAMFLLALNDFVFKIHAPSWLTGKLSDFTLLFLLPWLGLSLAAWLTRDKQAAARWVFGAIAVGFAVFKLVPAAGDALRAVTAAAGLPLYTRPDATDLLALVVLVPAWRLWQADARRQRRTRAWAALLPLAALLALADAAAPDYGITCFDYQDGRITATSTYGAKYASSDGGLTWQSLTGADQSLRCEPLSGDRKVSMSDPQGPVQYRFEPGISIERSTDGGATWVVDYTPAQYNQVRKAYADKTGPTNIYYTPGPFSALEDPATGNVIFAMGQEGVLVRQPSGQWSWVGIGPYAANPKEPVPVSGYLTLLWGELSLAIAAAMLGFSTLALVYHQKRAIRIVKLIIGWLGFLGAALVFPPALMNGGYSASIVVTALMILGIYVLISLLDDLVSLARFHPYALLPCAGFGLLAGLLFLLPYVLWAAEVLPEYQLAMILALALLVITLLAGFFRLRAAKNRRPGIAQLNP